MSDDIVKRLRAPVRELAGLRPTLDEAADTIEKWHAKCDEVGVPHDPDTLVKHHRASGMLIGAAKSLTEIRRLEAEVERLRSEGTPGAMHAVDRAFYDLTVAQRNAAWRAVDLAVLKNEQLRKLVHRFVPVVKMYIESFGEDEKMSLTERKALQEVEDALAEWEGL